MGWTVILGEGEPEAGPWQVTQLGELVRQLLGAAGSPQGRPPVVAVDGRSSSGKTTLSRRVVAAVPGAALVSTDDIAWWHSCFDWAGLLAEGVLNPVRAGHAVAYRPPPWEERGRPGAVEVPAGAALVVVEGVGAARRELMPLLDAVVYVQSDVAEAARRTLARVAAGEATASVDAAWMSEEVPFVAAQRPWERADVIVAGTSDLPYDRETQVVLSVRPPGGGAAPRSPA